MLSASTEVPICNRALPAHPVEQSLDHSSSSVSSVSVSSGIDLIISSTCDIEILSDGLNLISPWMTGSRGFNLSSWTFSSNFPSNFEREDSLFPKEMQRYQKHC